MIETVAETGSTNADLAVRIGAGEQLAEGGWLVADRQNTGRGRLGRVWSDGFGNFMGSTVVRPQAGDPPLPTLALMTGVAVYEALLLFKADGAEVRLKWPNDLLLDGGKIAGILLEMVAGVVVVGIGVNLAHAPDVEGRRTAALAQFGPAPDRNLFARHLAATFHEELHRWRTAGLAPLLQRWQDAAHPRGTPLTVLPPGEDRLDGTFAGLAADGSLLLALASGTVRTINAGDVMLAERR